MRERNKHEPLHLAPRLLAPRNRTSSARRTVDTRLDVKEALFQPRHLRPYATKELHLGVLGPSDKTNEKNAPYGKLSTGRSQEDMLANPIIPSSIKNPALAGQELLLGNRNHDHGRFSHATTAGQGSARTIKSIQNTTGPPGA